MKWVLARYVKYERFYEYIKNDRLEITCMENNALKFNSFADAEKFKKKKMADYDRPFYILSTPTVEVLFS